MYLVATARLQSEVGMTGVGNSQDGWLRGPWLLATRAVGQARGTSTRAEL
jgi:hypothetical protein